MYKLHTLNGRQTIMAGRLLNVSEVNRDRRSEKIGSTLFINGTPHVTCGRCGQIVKAFDAKSITFGKFKQIESSTMINRIEHIEVSWKLELFSRPGCFECWNVQAKEKAAIKASGSSKAAFFKV